MRKEDAIRILHTNYHRNLVKTWAFLQLPFLLTLVIGMILDISNSTFHLPKTGIVLPPPILTSANVLPAIFTGTVTGFSIVIGFFAISAYNFRSHLQTEIGRLWEDLKQAHSDRAKLIFRKNKIAKTQKISEGKEGLRTESQDLIALNESLEKCEEYEELINLNHDALAHQQEHIGKFLFTYLVFSVFLFIVNALLFSFCEQSSIFDWYVLIVSTQGFYSAFMGLTIFLFEFMTHESHSELG
jgi:hypothetical protein